MKGYGNMGNGWNVNADKGDSMIQDKEYLKDQQLDPKELLI